MGWLTKQSPIVPAAWADADPNDERYWVPSTFGGYSSIYPTGTKIVVTPNLAWQVSCIFHGIRLIAGSLGMFPKKLIKESDDGRKKTLARDHHLWPLLSTRGRPNVWQTAQQFYETLTAWSIFYGEGMAEIKVYRGGKLELWPLEPEWCELSQTSDGSINVRVSEPSKPTRTLAQDEVFRISGFGIKRYMGTSLLALCRETIGLWIAAEKFGALFFAQGAKPSVWLEHPGKLSDTARARLEDLADRAYSGLHQMHKTFIVEEGAKVKEVGYSARDSQLTQFRQDQVLEFSRWLNIPAHMFRVGQDVKTDIRVANREFVDYCLTPHVLHWESSVQRDLLEQSESGLRLRINMDALLRGDTKERYDAYAIGIMNGFLAENEARLSEDMDAVDGLDEPRRSANQDRGGDPRQTRDGQPAGPERGPAREEKKVTGGSVLTLSSTSLARSAAEFVLRREISAVQKKATDLASKPDQWKAWVEAYYKDFGEFHVVVMERMQVAPIKARSYTDLHRSQLLASGVAAVESWSDGLAVCHLLSLLEPDNRVERYLTQGESDERADEQAA